MDNRTKKIIEPLLFRDVIIAKSDNIIFDITKPTSEKIVLDITEPYEGVSNAYYTILKYNDKYYLYYRGLGHPTFKNNNKATFYSHEEMVKYECFCLAESNDGLNFIKPNYNIVKHQYIKKNVNNSKNDNNNDTNNQEIVNNVLKFDNQCHNFFPYYSKRDNIFYGISGVSLINGGLNLFLSEDGLRWNSGKIILTANYLIPNWTHPNHFDTHNCLVYNKIEDIYYIFVRYNFKNYRSVQYTKTRNFTEFTKCVEIDIANFNKNYQIYSPGIFEYPDSNYLLAIPTTGNEKVKDCNFLLVSKDFGKWNTISNDFFNTQNHTQNHTEKMNVNGIVIAPSKDKMYIYVNNNDLLNVNNVECFSVPLHRINKITSHKNGYVILNTINLIDEILWVNFETFNEDGYINVELMKGDIIVKKSKNYSGNHFDLLIEWDNCFNTSTNDIENVLDNEIKNDINNSTQYNIKFILYNCNLYSFAYNSNY